MKIILLLLFSIHIFAANADTLYIGDTTRNYDQFDNSYSNNQSNGQGIQMQQESEQSQTVESNSNVQQPEQELAFSGNHTGTIQDLEPNLSNIEILISGGTMGSLYICREFAPAEQTIVPTCNSANKVAFIPVSFSAESPAWENHPDVANAIRFKQGQSFAGVFGAELVGGHMKIYFSSDDPNSTDEADFKFIQIADIRFASTSQGGTSPPTTLPPSSSSNNSSASNSSQQNPYCKPALCVSPSASNGIHCGCNGFWKDSFKQPSLEVAGIGGEANESIWIRGRNLGRTAEGVFKRSINIAILSCATEQVIGFYVHDKKAHVSQSDPTKDVVTHKLTGVHLDEFKINGVKVKVLVPGGGFSPSLETSVSNCVQYAAP